MIAPVGRRLQQLLVVSAVLCAALAITTATPTVEAAAQDGGLLVEVTASQPLNPVPGGTLTVTGTVTNRSEAEISDLQALLRASSSPLVSRSAVTAVTDAPPARSGVAVEASLTPVAPRLAPGASAPFRVTAQTDDLPIGGNGVYVVYVEVRSSAGPVRAAFPMTWFPDPGAIQASRIAVMTPVRAAVDLTARNTLQSTQLLASMSPGGALRELAATGAAAAAGGIPMTWLIDPAVSEAADKLASATASFPASVADPAEAQQDVEAWLQLVSQGSSAAASLTYLTPYAEVDGTGVVDADLPDLLAQSVTAGSAAGTASLPVRNGLIYPAPEGTDLDTLSRYADAGISTIIASEAAMPPDQRLTYTPSGVADLTLGDGRTLTALVPDARLAADLQRPATTPAEAFRLQSTVLAQAAMITLELPVSSRTVLMLPASDATIPSELYTAILTALSQAPYTDIVGLSALLDPETARVDRSLRVAEDVTPALGTAYLAPVPDLQRRLDAFSRVTVDPLAFAADYQAAILRSTSANWRTDLVAGRSLMTSIDVDLTAEEGKVTTVSTGTVTFAGSQGTLPLTVSNGLQQAVEVGILLRADPEVRMSAAPSDLVRVDAGKRVSVEIPVEVYGSGPLPVAVILTDAAGAPFIETDSLTIRTTGGSLVAAAIAGVAGVALLVLVVWRFRRKGADQ